MGVEPKIGGKTPKWMVKIREHPKHGMIWGAFQNPYFWRFNTHIAASGIGLEN